MISVVHHAAEHTGGHFLQVAANQLLLAPVTLSAVFSWNLAWTGQQDKIGSKLQHDLLPTMKNGWKFWVPAASINFWAVPLEYQVRRRRGGALLLPPLLTVTMVVSATTMHACS
jgi:hypothetical protein